MNRVREAERRLSVTSRKKKKTAVGVEDLGDGRCRIRFELPPDLPTGERRQKSMTIEATPREAELRRADLILAARRGGFAIPKRMTVEQLMSQTSWDGRLIPTI